MKKIVILGAGFAGIRVTQDLTRMLGDKKGYEITLVDKDNIHLFRADLYEVATAYNEKITDECLSRLKSTIATPIEQLIDAKHVKFIQDEVLDIDPGKKCVKLKRGKNLDYDYLVVTLGSVTNFFGIPGMEEHAWPLKTIQDGLAVNCHLDQHFHELYKSDERKPVDIVIGGGGATGVEVAGELVSSLKKLCKKYKYPVSKIQIHIVEAGDDLAGLGKKGTGIIKKYFRKRKIKIHLGQRIMKVTKNVAELKDAKGKMKKIGSDILIWTGGVMVNPVVTKSLGTHDARGAIKVDDHMRSVDHENVYAAGDNAYFEDPENPGRRVLMLATTAFRQGKVIAQNLANEIAGQPDVKFVPKKDLYLIPIGGKFALWQWGDRILAGRWVWFVRRLVALKYSMSILPFWKALRKWHHGTKIFLQND